jgi:hypothetical protein
MLSVIWVNACIQVSGMLDSTGSVSDTRPYIWDTYTSKNITDRVEVIDSYKVMSSLDAYSAMRSTRMYAIHFRTLMDT